MSDAPSPATVLEPTTTGTVPFRDLQTWYRVNGSLTASDGAPLVVAHGGPGAAHNYCLPMTTLASSGRAVVLYDQVGCGNSTHRPDAAIDDWTVELFLEELANLTGALGIADSFHLLGQSWGGMLASEFAIRAPAGLRSLTISNSPASMPLWRAETQRLVRELPAELASDIERSEASGDYSSEEYEKATQEFYRRHVCRVDPMPSYVGDSFAQIEADPTVYHAMNGPSEFSVIGSLREWSVVGQLGTIAVPTLVLAGEHDEATPTTWQPFLDEIPDVRHHVFPDSSHMPFVEVPDAYRSVVDDFLSSCD